MPDAPGVGMADRATLFLDVGDEQDLWMLWMRVMRQENTFHFAKTARKVNILRGGTMLLAQAEHRTLVQRRFNGRKGGWGDRL